MFDITTLMGNILQNAVEAAIKADVPRIRVELVEHKEEIFIVVSNSLAKRINTKTGLQNLPSNVYISFGENCLTDRILERFHLKSFTTPYSHGRSNIEYINAIEYDDFNHFLCPSCLEYADIYGKQVVRSNYYAQQTNIYEYSVMNGFEFTHHDVIANSTHIETFKRRIDRLKELQNTNLYIFYHHRYCEETNIDQLIKDLHKIHTLYTKRGNCVHVILFTQKLVKIL